MKIYGSVFILLKLQGDYEDCSVENILACKTKALADHFKHRYENSFYNLHAFYHAKIDEIYEDYGREVMSLPDDVYDKWFAYTSKLNKYNGVNFVIEEIKLRRF